MASIDTDELRDNKIVVSTAAGIFVGNLFSEECTYTDSNSVLSHVMVNAFHDVSQSYLKEHSIDSPDNNDGYFCLENVQLVNGNVRTNFPFIVLFYDQVIGITVGNI